MDGWDQLRAAYVPRLRAQLDELDARLAATEVADATRLAHKIAGAAGSYGLAEVSAIARRVEEALEGGGAASAQLPLLDAMRAAIPEAPAPDAARVILVLGAPAGERGGLVVVEDPVDALAVAMDRALDALVVPYTAGPRGGRALLRSVASVEALRAVPLFVTDVAPDEADRVREKLGARGVFAGSFDERVLARVKEALS
jgi:HPt (histidine-containing phosphotransfer) domain-containing protein